MMSLASPTNVLNFVEPFPPPRDINLTHVRPGSMSELTFKWSQVAPACTDIQYSIISDCGQCPTITNFTTVICHGVGIPTNGRKCSFMVKTVVCGNINGFSEFERLSVNLKGTITIMMFVHK